MLALTVTLVLTAMPVPIAILVLTTMLAPTVVLVLMSMLAPIVILVRTVMLVLIARGTATWKKCRTRTSPNSQRDVLRITVHSEWMTTIMTMPITSGGDARIQTNKFRRDTAEVLAKTKTIKWNPEAFKRSIV